MHEDYTAQKKAEAFLQRYAEEKKISDICLLFSKETLIEFSYDSDWDWSIKDEMAIFGCTEEEARKKTWDWYMSMTHEELFYERTADYRRNQLIIDKAEDLGFQM